MKYCSLYSKLQALTKLSQMSLNPPSDGEGEVMHNGMSVFPSSQYSQPALTTAQRDHHSLGAVEVSL